MTLPRDIRKAIERADFSTVEDHWLAKLDEDPKQIDHFVLVARSLSGAGESDRSRVLLELVDDHLMKAGEWQLRLDLMERTRELHPDGNDPHDEILATLNKIYDGQPSLEGMIKLVGLHRAIDKIDKTWEKVGNLQRMMQFELGTVVAMEGRGVGRIVEVNLELASFKIDLDVLGEVRVGFKAAGKLMTPLAEDHFLRRKVEAPEEFERLKPNELLQQLLASYDRPLLSGEIKQALTGLVAPKSWSSWWATARKHRQVVAEGAGTKRTYRWAETNAEAGVAVLDQFATSKLDEQLKMLRKEGAQDAALGEAMAERLIKLGAVKTRRQPQAAFAIAWTLEREGLAEADSAWSTEILIKDADDPTHWVAKITDRLVRRGAYDLIRKRDDWVKLFGRLMVLEQEAKLLDYLAGELQEEDPEALETLLDSVLSQPRRQPAVFVWAAERIGGDDVLTERNPTRLIQMITSVAERPEFVRFKPRLKALVVSETCLAVLISRVTPDQAKAAEEALRRAHLDEYQRERLTTALHLRFPVLRGEQAAGLYATTESIDQRRSELKKLLEEEIPANRKAIEEAREMGDLRENFEYKSARQRHEYLSARVAEIDSDLRRVQPIEFSGVDGTEVRVGARVSLRGPEGDRSLTILGPWESRPEDDIVSYESDLAKNLLGKAPGDDVELFGEQLTIESIEAANG